MTHYYIVKTDQANTEQAIKGGWPHPFLSVTCTAAGDKVELVEYPVQAMSGDRRSMQDAIEDYKLKGEYRVMTDYEACSYDLKAAQRECGFIR